MRFIYNDGGRSKYFKATNVGDCVTRAICNATGKDYLEVYKRLKEMSKSESVKHHRGHRQSSVRDGVFRETWKKYLDEIGWKHVITANIGQSKKIHLTDDELPNDKIMIVQVSKHLTCIKNGVIYDTYDCSRDGARMVYGYWIAPTEEEVNAKLENERIAKELKEKQEKALNETKAKIEVVKKKYQPKLTKLEKKIKELQHELKIETNRMNKEINKIKKEDADNFCSSVLGE